MIAALDQARYANAVAGARAAQGLGGLNAEPVQEARMAYLQTYADIAEGLNNV